MKCEDCCLDVPDYARECPRCGKETAWGREVRRERLMKVAFGLVGVAILIGIIYAIITEPQRHPMTHRAGEPESASSPAAPAASDPDFAALTSDGHASLSRMGQNADRSNSPQ